jgi:hypothetical protein
VSIDAGHRYRRTVDSNLAGAINATTPLWTVLFALLAVGTTRLARSSGLAWSSASQGLC